MAATSLTTQRWASDLVINPLTSLCSYISVPPTYLAPAASCATNMRNKEEWNAGIADTTVCGNDVLDRDVAYQGHVSAYLFTPSAVARESFACQLCLPTALTHGRFASSLCLCLCPSMSLLLLTSKRPSKMCLAEQCCTVLRKPMRILRLSSPSGTLAPRSTGCTTTTLLTPKSVPTAGGSGLSPVSVWIFCCR